VGGSTSYFSESDAASDFSHASGATSVWEAKYGGKGYEWRKCFSSTGCLFFKHNDFPMDQIPRPELEESHPIQKTRKRWRQLNEICKPMMTTDYQDSVKPLPKISDFPDLPPPQVFPQPKFGEIMHSKKMKVPTTWKDPPIWTKGPSTEPKVLGMFGSPMYRYNAANATPKQEALAKLIADRQKKQEELKQIFDPAMMSDYMHMCRNVDPDQPAAHELTEKKLRSRR
jgi:hypothetical protein